MKHHSIRVATAMAGTVLAATAIFPPAAMATDGYFQAGYGAIQKSLAGAGSANPEDATIQIINPAGLVDVGRQLNISASVFQPHAEYTGTGTGFIAPGTVKSDRNFFLIPNLAYSHPIDGVSSIGAAIYGSGLATKYPALTNLAPGAVGPGVFGGGEAGVDLQQYFIGFGYARRFGNVAVGVEPVVSLQLVKAFGIATLAGASSNPGSFSDRGFDTSLGVGVRGGVLWNVVQNLRLGLSGTSPTWSQKFSKYAGLFADQGAFNVAGNVTAGVAWDVTPAATLLFDYKRIFFSSIGAVGNSSLTPQQFGTTGGPGFGWHDVNVLSFGAEWRATPDWTLRVGYAHNNNPVQGADVALNILAPAVVTDHFSGGFTYRVNANSAIDFAAVYVPRHTISGSVPAGFGGGNVQLAMWETEVTVGWTYKFDAARPVAGPKLITK